MAGPWFTVREDGEWQQLGTAWLSNEDGTQNHTARVEYRVTFTNPEETHAI